MVNEWQGEFQEDCQDFFQSSSEVNNSLAFKEEAEKYRKKGKFTDSLVHSLIAYPRFSKRLKTANYGSFSRIQCTFIGISPRHVMTGAVAIFLARFNAWCCSL